MASKETLAFPSSLPPSVEMPGAVGKDEARSASDWNDALSCLREAHRFLGHRFTLKVVLFEQRTILKVDLK